MPYKQARDLKPNDIIQYAKDKLGEVEYVNGHRVRLVGIKTATGGNVTLSYRTGDIMVYVMEEEEELC
jgi:hypothetical protein